MITRSEAVPSKSATSTRADGVAWRGAGCTASRGADCTKSVIFLLLLIVVAAITGYGFFQWQTHQIVDKLAEQIAGLGAAETPHSLGGEVVREPEASFSAAPTGATEVLGLRGPQAP